MTKPFRGILFALSVMLVFALTATNLAYPLASQPPPASDLTPTECKELFAQFTADPDWFSHLINPDLSSPEEVSQRLTEIAPIYACLGREKGALSQDWVTLQRLSEYFLLFAGDLSHSGDESALILTSLEQSDDPAIVKIRDQVGIPPPEGLIFVRFYSSRNAMPALIKQAFKNEDVAGATFLMRYIAVLDEEKSTWPEEALQRQTLPKTISHELVHAYINSTLGINGMNLPRWYHEGLAIYFSGSGESHTIITPDLKVSTTPPKEYEGYKTNFEFLEATLGREELLARIRASVEQANPAVLYQDLGISDDQELITQASAWQQRRYLARTGVFILVVVLIGWRLTRFIFEVRCPHCGYKGKREEFVNGYCPRCLQAFDR